MSVYEYKIVPAPTKGQKVKGARTPADRFAHALQTAINDLAKDGWDYLRADTLPSEEREGLMGKTTVYQNMLVFRRALPDVADAAPADEDPAPEPLALAAPVAPVATPPVLVADNSDATEPETPAPAPPIGTIPGQTRND